MTKVTCKLIVSSLIWKVVVVILAEVKCEIAFCSSVVFGKLKIGVLGLLDLGKGILSDRKRVPTIRDPVPMCYPIKA